MCPPSTSTAIVTGSERIVNFDKKIYKKYVDQVAFLVRKSQENMADLVCDVYQDESDDELNQIYIAFVEIANKMMRESSSCELKNEGCHICLEDEAKDPMYCLQCLKIIACKVCFRDYLRECKETLLKCLNCQRPSIVMYSLFNKVAKQKNDKFYAQIPEQYFDIVEDEEEVEEGS